MKPRVLVVDDEPAIVATVCAILEAYGFSPVGVTSGEEAIAKATDSCPDVLLCDVMMPGLNGFETGLQVKKVCPTCRLLFFTGYAEVPGLADDLKSNGHAFEVLGKPVRPAELVDKINAALAAGGQAL
jgi:CheY-like chemotaxis protein